MKLVISQRLAAALGMTHGLRVAGAVAMVLIVVAKIFNPALSWLLPALFACVSIAAALLYSILVDKAQKAINDRLKKLEN